MMPIGAQLRRFPEEKRMSLRDFVSKVGLQLPRNESEVLRRVYITFLVACVWSFFARSGTSCFVSKLFSWSNSTSACTCSMFE